MSVIAGGFQHFRVLRERCFALLDAQPHPSFSRTARVLPLCGERNVAAGEPRRKPVLAAALETIAQGLDEPGDPKVTGAGDAGDTAQFVRPGSAGTGLRLRTAPGGIAQCPAGATASGGRFYQCDR